MWVWMIWCGADGKQNHGLESSRAPKCISDVLELHMEIRVTKIVNVINEA